LIHRPANRQPLAVVRAMRADHFLGARAKAIAPARKGSTMRLQRHCDP
jgi:hypothetical protein